MKGQLAASSLLPNTLRATESVSGSAHECSAKYRHGKQPPDRIKSLENVAG